MESTTKHQHQLDLKLAVIKANDDWQMAEPDSQEENEAEDRLRNAVTALLLSCPEYKQYTMVSELVYYVKKYLAKDYGNIKDKEID